MPPSEQAISPPRAAAPSVGIVTCKVLPEPDPDQELLLAALRAAGLRPELLPWDDQEAPDPAAFDLCLLRSCWNYPQAPERFLAWVEHAAARTRLLNPFPAVRWNLHKRYMRNLEAAGVPVVPTAWFEKSDAAPEQSLREVVAERGWGDIVIKPAISAASYRTRRFAPGEIDRAARFLADLLTDRDAMIQPYIPSVETTGERALVWIDGALTHAVRKHPRFTGENESVSAAVPISEAERTVAEQAMGAACRHLGEDLLYARVDIVTDQPGTPVVAELELIEPSLFFVQHPPALERLVAAILERSR